MATAVCDTKPCDQMQDLIHTVMLRKDVTTQSPTLLLTALTKKGGPGYVKVHYCPFCGTRIVQGVFMKVPER